jgi:hypothetical protein
MAALVDGAGMRRDSERDKAAPTSLSNANELIASTSEQANLRVS